VRHGALRSGIIGASALALFALLIGAVGYAIYQGESRQIHARQFAELRVIGDLKTDQILIWRWERLGDVVGGSVAFGGVDLAAFVEDPGDATLRAELSSRLEALRRGHDYTDAILAAPDGRLLLSLDPNLPELDTATRLLVAQVDASREPAMGDFVRVESSGHVYIDGAAPILDASGRPLAVLILRSDPSLYLYPLIQSWPTPSESAETLLVRRDGDSVLFLNVLRHRADPALTLREPLSRTDISAVAAVLGRTGEYEGMDYGGVAVLADLRSIPGTPWFLVAKGNAAELLAEVGDRGRTILLLGLLVVLLTGGAVVLALSLPHSSLRRRLLRSERDHAAVAHFSERLLALARDVFLLEDASGRIVDANAAAVATYGYSRKELLQLNIIDLRAPETRVALQQDWQAAASPDGAQFETVYVRKDGSTFPVEVSSQAIDVDGVPHHQSFIRDITSRRAAEAQLRRLNAAYATLAETTQTIVRVRDEATLFANFCRIAVELGGYLGAWVGIAEPSSKRIVPVATAGSLDDYIRELQISMDPAEPEGRGPTALALREGRACYIQDFLSEPATAPWHDLASSFGIRASVALPLLRGGAPARVISLYAAEPHVFDGRTRALLEQMAADVSFALDGFDREEVRRRSEEALATSQAELASQLSELRRWNAATLGREERVLELKREVNDLLVRLGESPRFPSATDGADAADG